MELEILEKSKNELKIKFSEIDQGILNLIKSRLWEDKDTDMAGFYLTHPESGHPVFFLRTKKKDPKKVWNSTIDSISKQVDGLKKDFKKVK